jgi:hypothetical protein
MSLDTEKPILNNKRFCFVFSGLFALLLPISVIIFPFVMPVFNLLFFPFSLLHELGHFSLIMWLSPLLSPQIKFGTIEGELSCMCIIKEGFPCCWSSVISILGGSGSIIIIGMLIFIILPKLKSKKVVDIGRKYIIFGILADLPNLFPILPTSLGSVTDGYIIYTFVHEMGYLPLLPPNLSNFLSLASMITVLISFYFLGSFLYHIGLLLINEYHSFQTKKLLPT